MAGRKGLAKATTPLEPRPEDSNPKPITNAPGRRPRGETKNKGLTITKEDLATAAEHAKTDPAKLHASFQQALPSFLHRHSETVRRDVLAKRKAELDEIEKQIAKERAQLTESEPTAEDSDDDRGPLATENDI
jgi:hypothetical protein